jgi:hypothetical protein
MDVDSAVVFSPLVGFVNRVDAVDVTNAQIAERVEYCALCLVSANCPESPGDTDAGARLFAAVITTRFFATVITTRFFATVITTRFFAAVITTRFFATTVIVILSGNVFTAVTVRR